MNVGHTTVGFSLPIFLVYALDALTWLIIAEAIITNLIAFGARISSYHPLVKLVRAIVNPILNPVRRLLPPYKTSGWDLSPMIVIMALFMMKRFLLGY